MTVITLPVGGRGRRSAEREALYQAELHAFCNAIREIESTLDFKVSARGWCYILEQHGLGKGDFDRAQRVINSARKSGLLPLDICAEDDARAADCDGADAERDERDIDDIVETELRIIEQAHAKAIAEAGYGYRPFDFWHDQSHYVEMLVEKVDLKSLFGPICRDFHVPIGNAKGWPDINSRGTMMARFQEMEQAGKRCVLLYCGDFDPAGLLISDQLRAMFEDLELAVGWSADNLLIERFGLGADFIAEHRLSWIEGLETGSGRDLADTRHPDYNKPYVQEYIARFGSRKCEANALVTRPEAGRALCREAIAKYINPDAPAAYRRAVREAQAQVHELVLERLP